MVTTTFCVSGLAIARAGAGVSSTINTPASLMVGSDYYADICIVQGESDINATTMFNWTDRYSSLDADTKKILEGACADLAALYLVNYDSSGYNPNEAITMTNFLRDSALRKLSLLRDDNRKLFINGS